MINIVLESDFSSISLCLIIILPTAVVGATIYYRLHFQSIFYVSTSNYKLRNFNFNFSYNSDWSLKWNPVPNLMMLTFSSHKKWPRDLWPNWVIFVLSRISNHGPPPIESVDTINIYDFKTNRIYRLISCNYI